MITKSRRASIEQRAVDILQESGTYRSPVSVDLIVAHLGVITQARALSDGVSGVLVFENDQGVIGYNSLHAPVRQRFTLAHEIGHFVLHIKGKEPRLFIDKSVAFHRNDDSSTGSDNEEIEANVFAASLLMPESLVRREIEQRRLDLDDEDDIDALAKSFNVSPAAMTYRLVNIGLLRV